MTTDRGVSEVLGYVLIIGLVTALITVVMTMGIGGLESSQQAEQLNNMERAFDVLGHNIGKLTDQEAPSRATEFRLGDGGIGYGSATTFNVTIDNQSLPNHPIVTTPLVYSAASDARIMYESGSIIRSDGDSDRMIQEPTIYAKGDTLVVSIEQIRRHGGTPDNLEQSGTVLVRKELIGTTINETSTTGKSVNLSITSEQVELWEEYLSKKDIGQVTNESSSLLVEVTEEEFERVIIVHHHVRMTLSD